MRCREQTQKEILSCPSQSVALSTSHLFVSTTSAPPSSHMAVGNHTQDRERAPPSLKGCTSENHLMPSGPRIRLWDYQGGSQSTTGSAGIMSEASGVQRKSAFLMHLCMVSRYLIIHCSGRVVKRVLSFYRLLPQTSSNYKLDLYPGLFMAWLSLSLNKTINFTKSSIELPFFFCSPPNKVKVTFETHHSPTKNILWLVTVDYS